MKQNLISIVLPVHNGERYLGEAIRSCLDQTYENIELIIVDDCSNDNTAAIAQSFAEQDKRITVLRNANNEKLPASLNIGHKKARGNYITWTSDDNIYQKDAIATLYQTLIKRDVDIVYSEYLIINDNGLITGKSDLKEIEFLFFTGVIGACFLYKREVFERNSGYREDLHLVEDYDFWLRALKHSKYYKIDNPGNYLYRYHNKSLTMQMTGNSELKKEFITNLKIVYFDFFASVELDYPELIVEYLVDRQLNGPNRSIVAFEKKFQNDIEKLSLSLYAFSAIKLKKLLLNDAYETLLKNRKHQNMAVLYKLHRTANTQLLSLPIDRYFAIVKKCMF